MQASNGLKVCAALLAAGQSRRFGKRDKLTQDLDGKMLGLHMGQRLGSMRFERAVVIAPSRTHPCAAGWQNAGLSIAVNTRAGQGLGTSVALAARLAMDISADALVICLADMPFVPTSHISNLLRAFSASKSTRVIASCDGRKSLPPAVFAKSLFSELTQLDGHTGARALLQDAKAITIPPEQLADIDTAKQLQLAQARKTTP